MELRKRIPKPSIHGNAVIEIDSASEGDDDDDPRSGNDQDDQFYVPSSDSDDCSSSSDESGLFEEMEVLGVSSSGGKAPFSETNEMETGLNDEHEPAAQPPRAAPINFLNFLGSKRKKFRNYIPRKKIDEWSTGPLVQWKIWEKEHERWIDENMTEDLDSDHRDGIVNETADAPADLIMPLLQYQKEWLAWALKQEESTTRGGILADEMGMGKTIQAVALVLAKREIHRKIHQLNGSFSFAGSPTSSSRLKATLVVCPVVAVTQWLSEIERFTTKGSTKVLVHHGANRENTSNLFFDYDFVITTYSTVEAQFRKYVMPKKKKCAYCGKSFCKKKLPIHLKYYCGPNASRTAKQSKQDRKKVESTPLISELKTKSEKDKTSHTDISDVELCLLKRKSALHSVTWDRIILDEAHSIKSRHSNTAKSIFALESSYKWALTGTPLQNRVGELYSLVRFLQIVPYSYYLCKDCDCRILNYRSATTCSGCPHSSVRHFCWWNKYISNPIQAYGNDDLGTRAMILLKDKVLKNIVLRRTKKGRAADIALPPRTVVLRKDTLDVNEEDYYESLQNETQAQFNTYVKAGTVMNNYAHIFQLLTRLRQAVDHPYLVVYSKTAALKGGNMVNTYNVEQVCSICHEPAEDHVITSCAHVFCKACLLDFFASMGQVSCPTCSRVLATDLTANSESGDETAEIEFKSSSILNRIQFNNFQTSTKIEALREEIRFMVERDGSAKGIVFSQFTSFLDLIHYSLFKSGINCVQLVGTMSLADRDAAIKKFCEDADCKIFLISLKAGGVALNLTVASHVFLMDPWWNPAVEQQAQDRVHRIGQYKPIRIVRFMIENTVEERILQLQEKKQLVFDGTIGGSSEALGKLTVDDLRFLFVT